MNRKSKIWHISFDIIDIPPYDEDIGYVADYYRKEAIEKIKDIFSDFKVTNLLVKKGKLRG
jgi:hypothetical protein